jgi:hypothetical protein
MVLLRASHSRDSLVVCPSNIGNIARFISGVNNYVPEKARATNVRSARIQIANEAHVILYASTLIRAGDILRYDYNALAKQYSTENFK